MHDKNRLQERNRHRTHTTQILTFLDNDSNNDLKIHVAGGKIHSEETLNDRNITGHEHVSLHVRLVCLEEVSNLISAYFKQLTRNFSIHVSSKGE